MERARMPACLSALPEAYAPTFSLDLQRDRRTALLVNGLALLLCAGCGKSGDIYTAGVYTASAV